MWMWHHEVLAVRENEEEEEPHEREVKFCWLDCKACQISFVT